jgi:hypothetical protein
MNKSNNSLEMMLGIAVPLWIEKLRHASWDYIMKRASECSDVIVYEADNILYKSKKKGETAEAFNRLAEGIACLSFVPGGVTVFGKHWETIKREGLKFERVNTD